MEKQPHAYPLSDTDIKRIFSGPGFLNSIEETFKSGWGTPQVPNDKDKIINVLPPVAREKPTQGFVPIVAANTISKPISCNCKNSQCIKLYCECFRSETFCKDCNCENCLNKTDNPLRTNTVSIIRQKNPNAFESRFKPTRYRASGPNSKSKGLGTTLDMFLEVSRGCNCKHSNCKKKYCECYQYGIECSVRCKCSNCHNGNQSKNHPDNAIKDGEGSGLYGLNEGELKQLLLEKLIEIKRAKFPRSD